MNFLADNAIAIWMGGAVALTAAAVVFSLRRSGAALAALVGVVVVTAMLLVVEHAIETPREAVERTLDELAAAIEADDLPGVLAFIAPGANQARTDAAKLMPLMIVERARVTSTPEIIVDETTQPPTATVRCQGLAEVTVRQNGMRGPYMDRVTIQFVADGDRWLIENYTPAHDWHRAAAAGGGN